MSNLCAIRRGPRNLTNENTYAGLTSPSNGSVSVAQMKARQLVAAGTAVPVLVAVALAVASPARPHVTPGYCKTAATTQPRTLVGDPKRVYRAPHGCVWLERFDPAKTRTTPYRIYVRVHGALRVLQAPTPERLLHPEHVGFCGPSELVVQWPYVIHSAGQLVPGGAGRFVCSDPIVWVAQVNQYATRATWKTFGARI